MTHQELSEAIFAGLSDAIANCGKDSELEYAHDLGENKEYILVVKQGYDKTYTLSGNVYTAEKCTGYRSLKSIPYNGYCVRVSEKVRKSNKALKIALDTILDNRCHVVGGIEKSLIKNQVEI